MDNVFVTIAVVVMYVLMLMASDRGLVSPDTPSQQQQTTMTPLDSLRLQRQRHIADSIKDTTTAPFLLPEWPDSL